MRKRILPAALVLLGCAAAVIGISQLRDNHTRPHDFGSPAAQSSQTPPESPTGSARPVQPASHSITPTTSSARPVPTMQPAGLQLPTLHVTAPVEAVVTTDGVLGVPDDPAHVGWWTGSTLPGSRQGTTVIDGHVDSARTGIGALFYLDHLHSGDPVTITGPTGQQLHYRVYARQTLTKSQGLPASLFTQTGPPRLLLITCGGPFDHTEHSYLDNIAVFAAPTTG